MSYENRDNELLKEYAKAVEKSYQHSKFARPWYPLYNGEPRKREANKDWIDENTKKFFKGTLNEMKYHRWFYTKLGYITALEYSPNGFHVICGHSTGVIQMRHGTTGIVLFTLRNIQFPPKPVYALQYSLHEERICYAACADGAVYRIEIPNITPPIHDPPDYCIRADPSLECLHTQYYSSPGVSLLSTPYIIQRPSALSLGITASQDKLVVGYADTSIKIYDMETQQAATTYKVHKLRLQFIPKKLQRMHAGQVCALTCHDQRPFMFASGGWDNTLRIWDTRCKVGCVMTFEGVNICGDSIDLNRDHCISGSWQPTEALCVWDLVAKKRSHVVRIQNRRPNVDGEYIYTCRYWKSSDFNRKGKYGIIGGSGTKCLEVVNLHNRYIACSYPCDGTILAAASHESHIAFGGTSPVFSVVTFKDPKHEKYELSPSELDICGVYVDLEDKSLSRSTSSVRNLPASN